VLGAGSCPTARLDLAPISEKAAQKFGLLVVYDINLVCAKSAHLATGDEPPSLGTTGPLIPGSPYRLFVIPVFFVLQIYLPMYN
jgi:hypothetical protein